MAKNLCRLDNIPVKTFKLLVKNMCGVFSYILKFSIDQGIIPEKFECANVDPNHKSASPFSDINNVPISILPALSKVFEKNTSSNTSSKKSRKSLF